MAIRRGLLVPLVALVAACSSSPDVETAVPATTATEADTTAPSNSTETTSSAATPTTAAAPTSTGGSPITTAAGTGGAAGTAPAVGEYAVLYLRPDLSSPIEIPVAIAKGGAGAAALSDGRKPLPAAHYRTQIFPTATPGDVDGDGVDDLTELAGAPAMSPLNPARQLDPKDGVAVVPDRAAFEAISYQGDDVARDAYLAQLEFVKFILTDVGVAQPSLYIMNTETWKAHPMFAQSMGIDGVGPGRGTTGVMRGDIAYYPNAIGPDGTQGVYRFSFQPNDSFPFAEIATAYEVLATQFPFLATKLAYHPMQGAVARVDQEKALYDAYRVPVIGAAQLAGG